MIHFLQNNRDLSFLSDDEFITEINSVVEKFLIENSELLK